MKKIEGTISLQIHVSIIIPTHFFYPLVSCIWKQVLKASFPFWGSVKNLTNLQKIKIWRVTINLGILLLTENEQYVIIL